MRFLKGQLFSVIAVLFLSSFVVSDENSKFGVVITKSISEQVDGSFLVNVKFNNADQLESFAKYNFDLPKGMEFTKMLNIDALMNHKVEDRRLKIIWMHIRKNSSYDLSFEVTSKKNPEKLKFTSEFFGLKNGEKVSFVDDSKFLFLSLED